MVCNLSGDESLRPVEAGVFSTAGDFGRAAPMDLSSLESVILRGLSSGRELTDGEELGLVNGEALSGG